MASSTTLCQTDGVMTKEQRPDYETHTLIEAAAAADVTGWGFSWLDGRATEERPPWGYAKLLAKRLRTARVALDLDTGGGEVLNEAPVLAVEQHATEGWPPNFEVACATLGPRGVQIHATDRHQPLPFADATFDLVTSRHPVTPRWSEIARVLAPGGEYFAQHVGPASADELTEFFYGRTSSRDRNSRAPDVETRAANAAGLVIDELQTARLRMEFFDVGAVVWILRKCVWWVPDFDVRTYRDRLLAMDALIRREGSFVAYSSRHLVRARKPCNLQPRNEDASGSDVRR